MTTQIGVTEWTAQTALEIPKVSHAEAGKLAQTEYARVLALLESLEGDDWTQPTYCTEWDVRAMVAHLAAAVTGSTSFGEFRRQNLTNPYLKEVADPVDGINRLQLEERAGSSPAELVDEFRRSGQIAVHNRQKLPWLLRKLPVPMGAVGIAPLEYLMDTLYIRDQWMHRYDICAATGKTMVVTPEHDGRIVALVLRDIAQKLKAPLAQCSVAVRILGEVGGDVRFGRASSPVCTLEMDVFDFNLRASGRITPADAAQRATLRGDQAAATWFLEQMEVPY